MFEERLPTHIWIGAQIRQLSARAVPVAVLRKGEANSGLVIVKMNMLGEGFRVYSQARDMDGVMGWMTALKGAVVTEAEADAYIERSTGRDPDLWVVEIEDRSGENPFDGRVIM